MKKSKTTKRKN